jgi:cytochrome c556
MNSLKLIVVAVLFSALGGGLTYAHQPDMSDEMEAYIKRDGLMHLISSQRYILQEMLVGKTEVDQAEFVRAAKSLAAMFSMIPSTFQTNLMVDVSRAKPEIWQNWDDFVSKAEELRKIAEEIAAMAEIHGAEAALERVRQLSCGSCHDPYRN